MSKIKVRTTLKDGIATIRALIRHPMENGFHKDETGKLVPAHYIKELVCRHADHVVLTCNWGPGISKNPYLSFKIRTVRSGDPITLSWTDNLGQQDTVTAIVE